MSDRQLTIVEYAKIVITALDATQIRYALGGGLAVNTWVRREAIRGTHDIDFFAYVSTLDLLELCAQLDRRGIEAAPTAQIEFKSSKMVLRRIFCKPEMVVDFLATPAPYGPEALSRRVVGALEGRPTYILAPEDVILYKALAFRDKDRIDIEHMVEAHGPDLDRAYLEKWGRALRVWTRLSRRLGPPG